MELPEVSNEQVRGRHPTSRLPEGAVHPRRVDAPGRRRPRLLAPRGPRAPGRQQRLAVHLHITPFTISLLVYPIFVLDFLLLRDRPWVRVGLVAVLFAALQVTHAIVEPPADPYGTWANRISSVPHALGQPNLLDTASPILGALSVAVSSLLSLAVLAALVLLAREARINQLQPAG